MDSRQDLVLLGKVTKPHGIRGELKVYPYSGSPDNLLHYNRILLARDEQSAPVAYTVERARGQKNCVLLQLENCSDRDDSEALVNYLVYVKEQDLPELAEHEFYLRELEGKQVVTEKGLKIGRFAGILTTDSQDIARIIDGRKEYLVPLVPDFLVSIDEDTVTVSLPPGLLEINM